MSTPAGSAPTQCAALRGEHLLNWESDARKLLDEHRAYLLESPDDARAREDLYSRLSVADDSSHYLNLPPHAGYGALDVKPRAGDEVVITMGEQFGWRGRVITDYDRIPTVIRCQMIRPDGSAVPSPIDQRSEYVAKVLPIVPTFDSQEDAEAWLTAHDREVRPAYVPGETIRFRWMVRAKREIPELDGVLMKVADDIELAGKVVAFHHTNPITGSKSPAYRVMTLEWPDEEGEPVLLWVDSHRIVRE